MSLASEVISDAALAAITTGSRATSVIGTTSVFGSNGCCL
jgi:hypothetical protein